MIVISIKIELPSTFSKKVTKVCLNKKISPNSVIPVASKSSGRFLHVYRPPGENNQTVAISRQNRLNVLNPHFPDATIAMYLN